MPASRLALHPHIAHAYPLDYTEAANFLEPATSSGFTTPFTWGTEAMRPAALSPLFIYNPSGVALEFQVTIQWRLRLDPLNVMSSDHKVHATTTVREVENAIGGLVAAGSAFAPEIAGAAGALARVAPLVVG